MYGCILLENGLNKKEAFRYFKMSSDAGDSEGMYHYATMLQNGDGTPIDKDESSKYFKM